MNYQYPTPYGHGQNFRRGPGGRFDDSNPVNQDQNRKLFIGGLSYETDDQSLRKHFEKYGEIKDCVVIKDPSTKKSRGFGFITFRETKGLDEAQKERPHTLDGKEVETKRAMPRDDPQSHQTVMKMFVGGLKDTTTEDMIREAFSGNITKIELIKDKGTGKLRGFGFVTFDDSDTVDKHVLTKNFTLNGRRVEVKKAMDKNEMGYGPSGGYGRGDYGYAPSYGGYGPYGPAPNRGGYGGGNYGPHGGYGNQGWNQGGNYGDYGYGHQGAGYGSGGYGGSYNRR